MFKLFKEKLNEEGNDNLEKHYEEEFDPHNIKEVKSEKKEDEHVKAIVNELGGEEIFDDYISEEEKKERIEEVERYKKEKIESE